MYKITIEKHTVEKKMKGQSWEVIGEKEERGEFSSEIKMVKEWGYTPEIEQDVEVERKVFEQVVDNIDLTKVIMAINSGE